jgi:hypothetical protein
MNIVWYGTGIKYEYKTTFTRNQCCGSSFNADPDQTFESHKVELLHEKYTILKVGKRSKNISTKVQKPF